MDSKTTTQKEGLQPPPPTSNVVGPVVGPESTEAASGSLHLMEEQARPFSSTRKIPEFSDYKQENVGDFSGPYAIQFPGKRWHTKQKPISDTILAAHLGECYWVAAQGPWYPGFAYVDMDAPADGDVERVVEALGLEAGQYMLATSPSHSKDGSVHIIFRPKYNDKPATKKLVEKICRPKVEAVGGEFFPKGRRKFRLPWGRDQRIIDLETGAPLPYSWKECVYWTNKLDEYPLEQWPHQKEFNFKTPSPGQWAKKTEAQELLRHGLPGPGTRHDSTLLAAIYLYRENQDPNKAAFRLKHWTRAKHHGFSKEINAGRWSVVTREIDQIVGWVYSHYGKMTTYPDGPHNLEGWITPPDMDFVAKLFPGKIADQRRLFRLLCYMRPRAARHEWVYVPEWRWQEFAGGKYTKLQHRLFAKGLLRTTGTYRVGSYSKAFQLQMPPGDQWSRIEADGRAVHSFPSAAAQHYGSPSDARDALGIPARTARFLFSEARREDEA